MEAAGRKQRYFRYILMTFFVLMVLEFSLNIFGFASLKLNSSLWHQLNQSRKILDEITDGVQSLESIVNEIHPRDLERKSQYDSQSSSQLQSRQFHHEEKPPGKKSLLTVPNSTFSSNLFAVSSPTILLPLCPDPPPKLVGMLRVSKEPLELSTVERLHSGNMLEGGLFKPPGCLARHRVAIIIPFRDREAHLHIFLNHLLPILKRQLLEFQIYVVDLVPGVSFNRAMLMNIGFVESLKDHDWQCFVFHDVDLLPENDLNIYSCPEKPRHMSAAVNTMSYRLPYAGIFGGVSSLTRSQFETINGFSNRFFGWGGEDDDIYNRIRAKGFKITRYPMNIARYTMVTHKKDTPNPERFNLLNTGVGRMKWDGLNSLKYNVVKISKTTLFTRIVVDINEKEVMAAKGKS